MTQKSVGSYIYVALPYPPVGGPSGWPFVSMMGVGRGSRSHDGDTIGDDVPCLYGATVQHLV